MSATYGQGMRATLSDGYREAVLWHDTAADGPAVAPTVRSAPPGRRRRRRQRVLRRWRPQSSWPAGDDRSPCSNAARSAPAPARATAAWCSPSSRTARTLAQRYGSSATRSTPRSRTRSTTSRRSSRRADRVRLRALRPAVPRPRRAERGGAASLAAEHDVDRQSRRVVDGRRAARRGRLRRAYPAGSGRRSQRRPAPGPLPRRARRRARCAAGASLHPHVEVTAVEPRRQAARVTTERRSCSTPPTCSSPSTPTPTAPRPGCAGGVLPMGSFIIATEPLDDRPRGDSAADPAHGVRHQEPPLLLAPRCRIGRMVFGGRKRLGARDRRRGRATTSMPGWCDVHPQLAGVRGRAGVGRRVALTVDRLPHCGRIDGAWYAAGCNGSGVALTTWLGHRMAAAICGEPLPVFAELPPPPRAAARAACPLAAGGVAVVPRPGSSADEGPRGGQPAESGRRSPRSPGAARSSRRVVLADLDDGAGRAAAAAPATTGSRRPRSTRPTAPPWPRAIGATAATPCSTPPTRASCCRSSAARSTPARPTSTWRCRSRSRIPTGHTSNQA